MSRNKTALAVSQLLPITLATTAALSGAPLALAQGLEEVMVTAERRVESVQDVPISITAFTDTQIADLGIVDVSDLNMYTPNTNFVQVNGNPGQLAAYIRGVGSADAALINDPKVGTYVDGIYVSKAAGGLFDLVAPERIEVLRGPQGTLFGRNTTGGAISVTTKKPTGEWGVDAQATLGNYDMQRYRLIVDLPQFANISTQVAVNYLDVDGWADNNYNGPAYLPNVDLQDSMGAEENLAWRVAFRWEPTEDFTLDYDYTSSEKDMTNAPNQIIAVHDDVYNGFTRSPFPYEFLGGQLYQEMAALVEKDDRKEDFDLDGNGLIETDVDTHTLIMEWRATDTLTFKYLFGDREMDGTNNGTELDGGAYMARDLFYGDFAGNSGPVMMSPFFAQTASEGIDAQSHELQVIGTLFEDSLFYTGGFYYFDEETSQSNPQTPALPIEFILQNPAAAEALRPLYSAFGYCDLGPCVGTQRIPYPATDTGMPGVTDFVYGQEQESWAVYLQGTYSITEAVDITAGFRYTEDEKNAYLQNENIAETQLEAAKAKNEWDNFSYLFNVAWRFTDDANVYLKYSTGYNAGGFNARAGTVDDFQNPFDEEEVSVWELGLKSEWWDNRLRFNAAIFHNDYTDIQVAQFAAGAGGASSNIVNAGEATYQGFEMELTAAPTDGLLLNVSYGYLDAEYDEYVQRNPGTNELEDISDITEVSYAPEQTWTVGAQYDFDPFSFGQLSMRADVSYFDEIVFHPYQNDHTPTDDRTLLDARISLNDIGAGEGGSFRLSLWGKNLTDEEYRLFGIDFGTLGFSNAVFGAPRTYGLDVVYNFN